MYFYRPPSEGWGKVIVSVCSHRGGGGFPGPGLRSGGGSQSQILGGVPGLRFSGGGGPSLRFSGGGYPVSDFLGGGGNLDSVKGKIFDTRFGLIHVQTGEKNFCQGTPPPPAIARNCYGYAAGGMPLAFTQEDFLVKNPFGVHFFLFVASALSVKICINYELSGLLNCTALF